MASTSCSVQPSRGALKPHTPLGPPSSVPTHHLGRIGKELQKLAVPLSKKEHPSPDYAGVIASQEFFVFWVLPELLSVKDAGELLESLAGSIIVFPVTQLVGEPSYCTPEVQPYIDQCKVRPLTSEETEAVCRAALKRACILVGPELYDLVFSNHKKDTLTLLGIALLQNICSNLYYLESFAPCSTQNSSKPCTPDNDSESSDMDEETSPRESSAACNVVPELTKWCLYKAEKGTAPEIALRARLFGSIFKRGPNGSVHPAPKTGDDTRPSVQNSCAIIGELLASEALSERIQCVHFPRDEAALEVATCVREAIDIESRHIAKLASGDHDLDKDAEAAFKLRGYLAKCVARTHEAAEFVRTTHFGDESGDGEEDDEPFDFDDEKTCALFAKLVALERSNPDAFMDVLRRSLVETAEPVDACPSQMRKARRLPEYGTGLDWFAHSVVACARALTRCLARIAEAYADPEEPELSAAATVILSIFQENESAREKNRRLWMLQTRSLRKCTRAFLVEHVDHFCAQRKSERPQVRNRHELDGCKFTADELKAELRLPGQGEGISMASMWTGGVHAPENYPARDWRDQFVLHMLSYIEYGTDDMASTEDEAMSLLSKKNRDIQHHLICVLPIAFLQVPLATPQDERVASLEPKRAMRELWHLQHAKTKYDARVAASDAMRGLYHLDQLLYLALGRTPRKSVHAFWGAINTALNVDMQSSRPPWL